MYVFSIQLSRIENAKGGQEDWETKYLLLFVSPEHLSYLENIMMLQNLW